MIGVVGRQLPKEPRGRSLGNGEPQCWKISEIPGGPAAVQTQLAHITEAPLHTPPSHVHGRCTREPGASPSLSHFGQEPETASDQSSASPLPEPPRLSSAAPSPLGSQRPEQCAFSVKIFTLSTGTTLIWA